jgi:hypothetical protein
MAKYVYVIHRHPNGGVFTLFAGRIDGEPIAKITDPLGGPLLGGYPPVDLSSIQFEDVRVLDYYDEGLNDLVPARGQSEWDTFVSLYNCLRKQAGNTL